MSLRPCSVISASTYPLRDQLLSVGNLPPAKITSTIPAAPTFVSAWRSFDSFGSFTFTLSSGSALTGTLLTRSPAGCADFLTSGSGSAA